MVRLRTRSINREESMFAFEGGNELIDGKASPPASHGASRMSIAASKEQSSSEMPESATPLTIIN